MYKKLLALVAALATVMVTAATISPAGASTQRTIDTKVLTQNLYIGADIARILEGENPAAVFNTALASDFPGRATAFAGDVAAQQPDLVGLQEVTNIIVFNAQGETLNNIDYLEIVMGNLAAQGASYEVSSVVSNADVTLPIDPDAGIFARVIDRDVIIHNTTTTQVSNPTSENFETNFAAPLAGTTIEFIRGYTAVDATVGGSEFRFVNTHLEVDGAPCATPTGLVICQEVQADELVDAFLDEPLPVVMLGDFNSAPGETTYETLIRGGYVDTWNGSDGNTCCQDELLDNETSQHSKRIDLILYRQRGTELVSSATKTNNGKSASGLWYSDHAGVVASLQLESSLCASVTPTIKGTNGADVLIGTDGDDIIFAYGGNDTIHAKGGDDIVCAGRGSDVVTGGSGDDLLDGGRGADTLHGGEGDNTLIDLAGQNQLTSQGGSDVIVTGSQADTIHANGGNDYIWAGGGTNTVTSSSGNNVVIAGEGRDTVWLGNGNDYVDVGNGNNTVGVSGGDDTVIAGDGNDTIWSGSGSDTVEAGGGNNTVG